MRRDTGESYEEFLERLAKASGIETPTREDLSRLDRKRKKKGSNDDWVNPHDPDAKITKMKDGRTHLAHKEEHAVDMDTGAMIAVTVQPADEGDTTSIETTLEEVTMVFEDVLSEREAADQLSDHLRSELVADKGYHSRDGLKELHGSAWKTRISEPAPPGGKDGILRWHGDEDARRAVYANRRRLLSGIARQALKLRAEIVERAFALTLDRGGMRRTWLRGRDNVQKRYLIHIAGYNLGLVMRLLTGCGTPRRWAAAHPTVLWVCIPLDEAYLAVWIAMFTDNEPLPVAGGCFLIATADG